MRRAVAIALVTLAAACGREPANEYPAEVVENFVAACRTRTNEAACRCAIDELRDRFPWERFQALERRMADGEMPDEIAEAVGDCVRR